MTLQQYVSRDLHRYALTDVYFPQIGLHVEVNEPAHYESEDNIIWDLKRRKEIETNTGHQVFVIDCRQDIIGIHLQIDQLIVEINSAIKKQKLTGVFKSWSPEDEYNPNYWKDKDSIRVSDDISFFTIEDICLLFDADYQKTKRGFLRKGAIVNPRNINQIIWWPSERSRSGWLNKFDEESETITETHSDPKKKSDHYYHHAQVSQIRICFFHNKNILGLTNYKYFGVFTNDIEKSNPEIGTVWKRIGDKLNLVTTEIGWE